MKSQRFVKQTFLGFGLFFTVAAYAFTQRRKLTQELQEDKTEFYKQLSQFKEEIKKPGPIQGDIDEKEMQAFIKTTLQLEEKKVEEQK